ncbi:Carboxy-terminal processing protease [hydrothermal vent metagenome]|uniref:Carboxy-terminal processing protease n=1 Tax=hydrothermal vent metagenome TaxID=652676 RepID=A0A3B0UCH5_9ZZZZ
MTNNSVKQTLLPIWLGLAIATGIVIGAQFVDKPVKTKKAGTAIEKMKEVLLSIDNNYVDSISVDLLVEEGIKGMLKELDPHTSYIPSKEINRANASLRGSYDGIGIEFDVIQDTIIVVLPIKEGPSQKAGIEIGDRIIVVNEESVIGIDSKGVTTRLLGEKGSEVGLVIYRPGTKTEIPFKIKRGSIYQPTVDAFYMIDEKTGYIKLHSFGLSSATEISDAIDELKLNGMKQLVFDLQSNPGGYLRAAEKISDEFIKENAVIVSQKGKTSKYDDEFRATTKGSFETQPVIVLVDEYSASASEIVAGALQDNDRALIVGRRSFGKGLVQLPISLTDGSELRLTIARYYTPSGRSIQKSYKNGNKEYAHDLNNRYTNGEFYSVDSIHVIDSLAYKTVGGRVVHGGGGIMPDIFVPLDTTIAGNLYTKLLTAGALRLVAIDYIIKHKEQLYEITMDEFAKKELSNFNIKPALTKIAASMSITISELDYEASNQLITGYCKAEIARLVWGGKAYYKIMNPITNQAYKKSLLLFDQAMALSSE